MNKFSAWLLNFMRGRYGFDQLGRSLSVGVVVCWIISIVFGVLSNFLGIWIAWVSTIFNWLGILLLFIMLFRIFSRSTEKRSAENQAYLAWRQRRNGNANKNANRNRNGNKDAKGGIFSKKEDPQDGHTFLTCSFCGQQMRVPKGKGKIAVRCPKCGEKTIINS